MPGIFGIIPKKPIAENILRLQIDRMAHTLKHFEFYNVEKFYGDNYGACRIGIPYRNYSFIRYDKISKRGVIFDGYIYGGRGSIAQGLNPSNPILSIPLDEGTSLESIPAIINGSFAMMLFDQKEGLIILAKDRLGYRNLYLYEDESVIAFAPEMKAFLALDSYQANINIEGIADFFNYGFLIGGRTYLKNVQHIYPASIITIKNNSIDAYKRYWEYKFEEPLGGDVNDFAIRLYKSAQMTLSRQMGDQKNFIISLSGGMDSRALSFIASKTDRNIFYYAHGQKNSEDVTIARIVAKTLGIENKFSELRGDPQCYSRLGAWTAWLVDGMIDINPCFLPSVVMKYKESPLEFEFLNSIFSGTMNFACLFGCSADINKDISPKHKLSRLRENFGAAYANDDYYSLFTKGYRNVFKTTFDSHILSEFEKMEISGKYFLNQLDRLMLETRILRLSGQFDLNRYFYHDHFALIDDEMFSLYLKIPLKLKVERMVYKKMMQKLMPEMADIIYQKTGTNLFSQPSGLSIRMKTARDHLRYYLGRLSMGKINLYNYHNYTQPDQWYRKYRSNREFYENILLDERTLSRGYYNLETVKSILKKQAMGSNNFFVISNLTTFELFNRYFIDREAPPVLKL